MKRILQLSILLVLLGGFAVFFSCESDDNAKPTITFIDLANGDEFNISDTIQVAVQAYDSDGSISEVSLYIDNTEVFTGTEPPYSYTWITNDMTSGNSYTIKATAIDSDAGKTNKEIEISISFSKPATDIILESDRGVLYQSMTFTDNSLYIPTSWLWDFGDGTTSTEQNPEHAYQALGTYDVQLITSNQYGTDTLLLEDAITIIPATVQDYDGNEYKIVQIGEQIWTQENLKSTHFADGEAMPAGSYMAYDNNDIYVDEYGRLYTVEAALRGGTFDTQIQGACPDGWHIPSIEEWTELTDFLGGKEIAGGKLKEEGTEHWLSPNTGATNESGFTALGAGLRYNNNYIYLKETAIFWTSTGDMEDPMVWDLYYNTSETTRYGISDLITEDVSIRCIKDE